MALASLGTPKTAQAQDQIDKEAMKWAMGEFRRESYIIGGLTLAGGLTSSFFGTLLLFLPQYKDRRSPGIPLFTFGQIQSAAGTWILLSGHFEPDLNSDLLELATPEDFRRLALPEKLRDARILKIGLITDLVITGLSLPLFFPVKPLRDWYGVGVLMVIEGIFSAATAYAYHRSLGAYIATMERYGAFVEPPMGPQSTKPFMFNMKFAF